jgi:hypothetical protein
MRKPAMKMDKVEKSYPDMKKDMKMVKKTVKKSGKGR